MVYARLTNGSAVVMTDGDAAALKERQRAGEIYRCIVPDCPNEILNVVDRRGKKRDGFSHRVGGGHGVGLSHLQAQLRMRDWLRREYPTLIVELEETTDDRKSRADVMATSPRTKRMQGLRDRAGRAHQQCPESRHSLRTCRGSDFFVVWVLLEQRSGGAAPPEWPTSTARGGRP